MAGLILVNMSSANTPTASAMLLASVIAPLATLQDRCLAAPGLLAAILVGKYCDHLPLYRQEQIFATRHQVQLPRQTMAQWMGLAADWLRPIYDTAALPLSYAGVLKRKFTFFRDFDSHFSRSRSTVVA